MSDNPTREDVLKSIEPKSDQLNADDLVTGPITTTITGVKKGDREQPVVVEIEGHRPYKPCKTMRRILIAAFSDEPAKWIGQRLTLYCDPEVMWGGVKVGGIRISHLSIDEPRTFIVTTGRGKRQETTVHPIAAAPALSEADKTYIEDAKQEIAGAKTLADLAVIGEILSEKSDAVKMALRDVYKQRTNSLKDG